MAEEKKKTTAKKASTKKAAAKKAPAKKAAAKKTPAKKAPVKKTEAKKAEARKSPPEKPAKKAEGKKINVTLVKSMHGRLKNHQASVRGLGLRRMHQTVTVEDTPENRGMIRRAEYMLRVEEA